MRGKHSSSIATEDVFYTCTVGGWGGACDAIQVDATEQKELATRFGITGFPSLKFFPRGKGDVEQYDGGRDLESLVKFLNEKVSLQHPSSRARASCLRSRRSLCGVCLCVSMCVSFSMS